jgi:hypothetical protein
MDQESYQCLMLPQRDDNILCQQEGLCTVVPIPVKLMVPVQGVDNTSIVPCLKL